jgi:hypothetical protein
MSKFDYREQVKDDRPDFEKGEYARKREWGRNNPILLDYPMEWTLIGSVMRVRFYFKGWRQLSIDPDADSCYFLGAQGPLTVSDKVFNQFSSIKDSSAYAEFGRRVQIQKNERWFFDATKTSILEFLKGGCVGGAPPGLFFRRSLGEYVLDHFSRTLHNLIQNENRPIVVVGTNQNYQMVAKQFRWAITFVPEGKAEIDIDDVLLSLASPVFMSVARKVFLAQRPHSYYFFPPGKGYHQVGVDALEASAVDRTELRTYHETLVAKEMVVYNSCAIKEIVKANPGRSFSFPGDGAGTGAEICLSMNVPFIAGDICPRHNHVARETIEQTIQRTPDDSLVVLSFVMAFLSDAHLKCLKRRDVICIDRHKLDVWNYLSSDMLVSGTIKCPIIAMRDNAVQPPPPVLQMFLNNKRDSYDVDLPREELISFMRFLLLHAWNSSIVVRPEFRQIAKSYGFYTMARDVPFDSTVANDPLHGIDFFNGVSHHDRVMISGVPAACHVNHVLLLPANPFCEGSVTREGLHYLRFREEGDISFHLGSRTYTVRVHPFVSLKGLTMAKGKRKKKRVRFDISSKFEPIVPILGACECIRFWDYAQV